MAELLLTALDLLSWFKEKYDAMRENGDQSTYLMKRFILMEPKLRDFQKMTIKAADKAILRQVADIFQEGKTFIMKYTEKTLFRAACRYVKSGEYAEEFASISAKVDSCLLQ